MHILKLLN